MSKQKNMCTHRRHTSVYMCADTNILIAFLQTVLFFVDNRHIFKIMFLQRAVQISLLKDEGKGKWSFFSGVEFFLECSWICFTHTLLAQQNDRSIGITDYVKGWVIV